MFHKPKKQLPILINKNIDTMDNNCLSLFLILPGGGTIICYDKLGSSIDNRKVYGIEFTYKKIKDQFDTPDFKMEWLADLYAQEIISVVQGPCLIGGWSAGGVIAYATAKRMQELGYSVPLMIMIDIACPNVYGEQKDKIAKVNYQALLIYIGKVNEYFNSPVLLEDLEKNEAFDLNMHLPDLMRFVFDKLDIEKLIKKDMPIEGVDRFNYTIEGIVRAVLDSHITESVESILFIKAGQSDISTGMPGNNIVGRKYICMTFQIRLIYRLCKKNMFRS